MTDQAKTRKLRVCTVCIDVGPNSCSKWRCCPRYKATSLASAMARVTAENYKEGSQHRSAMEYLDDTTRQALAARLYDEDKISIIVAPKNDDYRCYRPYASRKTERKGRERQEGYQAWLLRQIRQILKPLQL